MTTLYNCHHDGDQYRITKFVDGSPEGSYLTTFSECECPAGHRDTCRHRQMLPEFIDRNLVNTHLFLNWDDKLKPTCDFEGNTCIGFLVPAEVDLPAEPAEDTILEGEVIPPGGINASGIYAKDITPAKPANWRRI